MHKQRIAVLVAAGLGVLACFLPWVNIPILGSVTGMQGDAGKLLLAAFAAPAMIALLGDRASPLPIGLAAVASVIGTVAGAEGIFKIIDFNQAMGTAGNSAGALGEALRNTTSVGIGLYLVVAAGLGIPVSQFVLRR